MFVTFFEAGRVALLYEPRSILRIPDARFVMANVTVNFLAEMHWPGDVVIGTGVARLGRRSLTFDHALFVDELCTAWGQSTVVLLDVPSGRPRPFAEDVAARIRAGIPAVPMVD